MYKREIPYSLADFSSTLQNPEMNSSKMRKGQVSAPWDTPRGHPEGRILEHSMHLLGPLLQLRRTGRLAHQNRLSNLCLNSGGGGRFSIRFNF